jgi:hypothetical protein
LTELPKGTTRRLRSGSRSWATPGFGMGKNNPWDTAKWGPQTIDKLMNNSNNGLW